MALNDPDGFDALLLHMKDFIPQLKRIRFTKEVIRKSEMMYIQKGDDTRMFVGSPFRRIRVVGWSTNLQSSFGVTTGLRTELANQVRKLAASTEAGNAPNLPVIA